MADIKIRYYSLTGNTKKVAEYIAKSLNMEAKSIDDKDISCDLLFLGGAPYANIMSKHLKEYANKLDSNKVKNVALFTTSNWSRRTVRALKKILANKGINVYDEYLYVHMLSVDKAEEKTNNFVIDILNKL